MLSLREQAAFLAEARCMKNFFSLILAAGVALGVAACQGSQADTAIDSQIQTVDFQLTGMT